MALLERAVEIAARAHAGQVDKAGEPYILHPLRVMLSVSGELERVVAVLHDVVEDSSITFEQLLDQGIPRYAVEALEALTKRPGESRLEAVERTVCNPVAREVKIADVTDNMDLSRLGEPSEADLRRQEQYRLVLERLLEARGKELWEST